MQQALEATTTAPQNANTLALANVNPYVYQQTVASRQTYELLAVAVALSIIGALLISRTRLARPRKRTDLDQYNIT